MAEKFGIEAVSGGVKLVPEKGGFYPAAGGVKRYHLHPSVILRVVGGRMFTADLYVRVRLACHVGGQSQREAASHFGMARETVKKMLRHSEPLG